MNEDENPTSPINPAVPPVGPPAGQLPGAEQFAPAPPMPPVQQQQWAPAPTDAQNAAGWYAAYLKTRRQLLTLSIATAAVAVLALGLGAWGVAQAVSGPGLAAGNSDGMGRGQSGQGGPAGMLSRLFNSDGSLNQTEIDELKSRVQSGGGPGGESVSTMLQRAVEFGALTQAQADQLLGALGTTATPTPAG